MSGPHGAVEAARPKPGPFNALSDVAGVRVGHVTRDRPPFLTGTTAVLFEPGATAGVEVRGGAPATRETDLLRASNLVELVDAIVLSGGSAYGLDALGGTMRWLAEHDRGFRVGALAGEVVPIVPGACLFDLGRAGDFAARPDASFGYDAAEAAASGPLEQGNCGAGTGAVLGRLGSFVLKGGTGNASVRLADGSSVAALVALNAAGAAIDPSDGHVLAAGLELDGEFGGLLTPSGADLVRARARLGANQAEPPGASNTVLAVVATDATLSRAEAARLAAAAHDGLARAVRPAHTLFDGDTVFAASTGAHRAGAATGAARAAELSALYEHGADCLARAVVHALLAARSVGPYLSYRDAFPSAFTLAERQTPLR